MSIYHAYWLLLGLILGTALIYLARHRGVQREQRLLANALIVAAIIYVGFALVWGDSSWLLIELAGVPAYGLFYWLAYRQSFYWLALGWSAHPAWDIFLHLTGPGHDVAPAWYATACISFDFLLAAYIVASANRWQNAADKAPGEPPP